MQTIEDEIEHLITFISHPAGFSVDMESMLVIRPVYHTVHHWEVDWQIDEADESGQLITMRFQKIFNDIKEAATFFVEKRHYMCLGIDFNEEAGET
jgi:hypothetical protein